MTRHRSHIHHPLDEDTELMERQRFAAPARADEPSLNATVAAMQRRYGNSSLSQLADADRDTAPPPTASQTEPDRVYQTTTSYQLSASMRQSPAAGMTNGEESGDASRVDHDSPEGADDERVTELEDGSLEISESDAVNTAMEYTPTIGELATPPTDDVFGLTTTSPAISDIAVAHDTAAQIFNVTAKVANTITWSVKSRGRTDIDGANSAAITQDNHTAVAADLTPNMSSDNGRPPRTTYWAKDLTERHERFHANERANTYGRPAFNFSQNWLANQTANTSAEATTLARRVPSKMHESYSASYSPGKESRAYGDGAPSYQARADAILAKGRTRGYALGETDLYRPNDDTQFA